MKTKFQSERSGEWLCFKHAIKRAVLKGEHIEPICDEDDFCSEYDMRDTSCSDCIKRVTANMSNMAKEVIAVTVLQSVIAERQRQDAKWGQQNHEPIYWLGILGEEFGELCEAINETVFDNGPEARLKGGYDNMRAEAVQLAAVAVAFVEMLDRRYGTEKKGEGLD